MSSASAVTAPLTIAVVKPCCIGDCVMTLPAIESLAAAFPFAHIHAFAGRHSAPVFRASEHISRVYLSPDQLTPSRVPGMAWNLRTAGHDWIVVLDRSRLLLGAARSANPSRLVTLPRGKHRSRHEIDVYLDALAAVGVKPRTKIPTLVPHEDAREAAAAGLDGINGPFAVMHPGGAENPGATMLDKRWPADRYIQVARELSVRGIETVFTGGPSDVELCADIVADVGATNARSVAGKLDLMATAAAIEKAELYIGGDTGLSHLAAAVGTRCIIIFGPTNPDRYAPRGNEVTILAPERSRSLADIDLRKVRNVDAHPTTRDITTEQVLAEAERLLAKDAAGS